MKWIMQLAAEKCAECSSVWLSKAHALFFRRSQDGENG